MLGLRPPGLEFRILCLEDSVISIISPSSGGSPGPVKPICAQRWPKARFISFLYWIGTGYLLLIHKWPNQFDNGFVKKVILNYCKHCKLNAFILLYFTILTKSCKLNITRMTLTLKNYVIMWLNALLYYTFQVTK